MGLVSCTFIISYIRINNYILDRYYFPWGFGRPDIELQCFPWSDLLDPHLFIGPLSLIAQQPPEQIVLDITLDVYLGEGPGHPQDTANQPIIPGDTGIHEQPHPNQPPRHRIQQTIIFRQQRHNPTPNGRTLQIAVAILPQMPRSNLHLHAHTQHPLYNTPPNHPTLKFVDRAPRFIHVETPYNDHFGWGFEVSRGHGDFVDGLADCVDVVLQLGGDGDDGGVFADGVFYEVFYLLVVLNGTLLLFEDDVDFVLEDDDVLEFHDVEGDQVLAGLGLWAVHVGGDEEQSGVHYGCAGEHSREENVVAWTVHEGDVPELITNLYLMSSSTEVHLAQAGESSVLLGKDL